MSIKSLVGCVHLLLEAFKMSYRDEELRAWFCRAAFTYDVCIGDVYVWIHACIH